MLVLSFCPDAPALAVIADRWRQEPPPFLVRDTTQHSARVSLALALRRSGATYPQIALAAKAERKARPVKVRRREHEKNRHIVRIYSAKLFESDVIEIRERWAKRQRGARKKGRTPSHARFVRETQARLAATNLHVCQSTIRQVMDGSSWHGVGGRIDGDL